MLFKFILITNGIICIYLYLHCVYIHVHVCVSGYGCGGRRLSAFIFNHSPPHFLRWSLTESRACPFSGTAGQQAPATTLLPLPHTWMAGTHSAPRFFYSGSEDWTQVLTLVLVTFLPFWTLTIQKPWRVCSRPLIWVLGSPPHFWKQWLCYTQTWGMGITYPPPAPATWQGFKISKEPYTRS